MNISVAELRQITNRIYDHLEETGNGMIELTEDYYWIIHPEALYDPYNEPKNHYLGQLFDDYSDLKQMLNGPKDETITYGMIWLSSIVRYIGEKVSG